jgi:hypothetical protein
LFTCDTAVAERTAGQCGVVGEEDDSTSSVPSLSIARQFESAGDRRPSDFRSPPFEIVLPPRPVVVWNVLS